MNEGEPAPAGQTGPDLPADFLFGASTAAYQIEGAIDAEGKGTGIWDAFVRLPGRVLGGDTGDEACDHFHRFEEDLDLAAAASLKAYRFSLNWSRILPEGSGRVNEAGLDFYDRLVDACLKRGIEPWPCLYHWDYSQALQDRGGWSERQSIDWYLELCAAAAGRLGDRAKHWALFNEPSIFTALGNLLGIHAPGIKDSSAYGAAVHHVSLATAEATRFLRHAVKGARIGTVLSVNHATPASDRPEDVAATAFTDAVMNRSFLDPLYRGTYPAELMPMIAPHIRPGDFDRLRAEHDWVGLNHYTRTRITAKSTSADAATAGGGLGLVPPGPGVPVTDMGWEIWPEGIGLAIRRLVDEYGAPPIYVTENGGAFPDVVDADGRIRDSDRIALLDGYLREVASIIAQGYDVRGYLVWSLLDNFEWTHGYSKRFGLIHVDYETQVRTPKDSYHWYANLARKVRGPA